MPLTVPNLDDRTFDDLVVEGRALIPRYTKKWTNHNVSDPGITLMELFAWLTETAIYQSNRVPDGSVERFLALVGTVRKPNEPLVEAIQRAVRSLTALQGAALRVQIQPPLRYSHEAGVRVVGRQVEPTPVTRLARGASRGEQTLHVLSGAALSEGDVAMLEEGSRTEFVQVGSVPEGSGPGEVRVAAALRFRHAPGVALRKVATPERAAATTFDTPARAESAALALALLHGRWGHPVLKIEDGERSEHVQALTVAPPARAVTLAEVEALAKKADEAVARCKALVDEDAVLRLIPVPKRDEERPEAPQPSAELVARIWRHLRHIRPLTTRFSVLGPQYVQVSIEAEVVRRPASRLTAAEVKNALLTFLHPLRGGPEGQGWPFGRGVYRSELYQVLEGMPGVDHVHSLSLHALSPGGVRVEEGIHLPPLALVQAEDEHLLIKVRD